MCVYDYVYVYTCIYIYGCMYVYLYIKVYVNLLMNVSTNFCNTFKQSQNPEICTFTQKYILFIYFEIFE